MNGPTDDTGKPRPLTDDELDEVLHEGEQELQEDLLRTVDTSNALTRIFRAEENKSSQSLLSPPVRPPEPLGPAGDPRRTGGTAQEGTVKWFNAEKGYGFIAVKPSAEGDGGLVRPAPMHAANEMGFDSDAKLRQESWQTIGERTRTRLGELAGGIIDWYAYRYSPSQDGRAYAVVFGDRGLSIAEPRVNTENRPVYAISAFVFAPGTLRQVRVDHRPPPHVPPPGPPGPDAVPDIGLGPAARRLLGNLPPRAQELLQAPFTSGQRVLRCDWYYDGGEHHLNAFMIYLAGARDVTVATGSKVVPVGHTDTTAYWALTCYRASVARRIGSQGPGPSETHKPYSARSDTGGAPPQPS